MLVELHVRGLGVIEDTAIELGPGLTAISGETGAGKTLIVDALDFVLGGKPRRDLVVDGVDAMVEACFVDDQGTETILRREMPVDGRARTFIDGRSATASALAEIGAKLCDIHGQHEHQSLLGTGAVREALDTFGSIDTSQLSEARIRLRDLEDVFTRAGGNAEELSREAALLDHEISEIEACAITGASELDNILEELNALESASEIQLATQALLDCFESIEGGSPRDRLRTARNNLEGFRHLAEASDLIVATEVSIDELTSSLRRALDLIDTDPERKEFLEHRASLLHGLARRYGPLLENVLERLSEKKARFATLHSLITDSVHRERDLVEASNILREREAEVLAKRLDVAPKLARAICGHLDQLALKGAKVLIESSGSAGDDVTLLFSGNLGHEPKALARVASGGELARLMLAINLAITSGPPTMVFDEVDAGVGGATALVLGQALRALSTRRQVLVVTHLAQVAAQAERQVSIVKDVAGGRAVARALLLEGDERTKEIARMLAGNDSSEAALLHAKELLDPDPITTNQLRFV